MPISNKFTANFNADQRLAGERLLTAGSLLPLYGSPELFRAEVSGQRGGEVSLKIQERRLRGKCFCPEQQRTGTCCHLWAALRLADQQGELIHALKKNVARALGPWQTEPVPDGDDKPPRPARPKPADGEDVRLEPAEDLPRPKPAPLLRPQLGSCPAAVRFVLPVDLVTPDGPLVLETWWQGSMPGTPCRPLLPDAALTVATADEQQLLALVWSGSPWPQTRYHNRFALPDPLPADFWERLAESGSLRWYDTRKTPVHFRKLNENRLLPATFTLQLHQSPDPASYILTPRLLCLDTPLDREHLAFIHRSGLLCHAHNLYQTDWKNAWPLAARSLAESHLTLSRQAAIAVARQNVLDGLTRPAELPDDLGLCQTAPKPKGELYITVAEFKVDGREQLQAELNFNYNGVSCPESSTAPLLGGPTPGQVIARDPIAEEQLKLLLLHLGFTPPDRRNPAWRLLPARLDAAVRSLVMQDWIVRAAGKSYRRPAEQSAAIRSLGLDWFELDGGVDFGPEKIPLPTLLQALRRGQSSVRLDDGTFGILPLDWLENFTLLTEIGEEADGKIRLRREQLCLLEALLQENLNDADGHYTAALAELRRRRQPRPSAPPESFHGQLRPYQEEGLGWLQAMRELGLGVCLADDMGLGKTVQVLALLAGRRRDGAGKPSLLVLPRSLLFNWSQEANRFTPQLKQLLYTGASRQTDTISQADLILTTYGTLRQDVAALAAIPFDYCILDESQTIKNRDSLTARSVRAIRADHRLTLTGTPIENRLSDLFSQLDFLNPGLFRPEWAARFIRQQWELTEAQSAALRRAVTPFFLRRRKADVAKELPAKSEQTLLCDMTPEHARHYQELQDHYRLQLLRQDKDGSPPAMETLTALLRLRQAACHAVLLNPQLRHVNSAKIDLLLDYLQNLAAEGHKSLVFSQFTSLLQLVRNEVASAGLDCCYLDGQSLDRQAQVEEFQQNPAKSLFLISLKAGGVGLNLTAADYVFILDPWWNPAAEAQAIDRAYRIGQQRPVFAYRLISRDTIEEKVVQMQQAKRQMSDQVMTGIPDRLEHLTAADLTWLLK